MALSLLGEHLGAGLLQTAAQGHEPVVLVDLDALDWIDDSDVAVLGDEYVAVVNVAEHLLQVDALVDEHEDLCRQELVEPRVVQCEDYLRQVAAGD